ncbi:hypothetical protein [Edaphovirga cremea]|uniref:hypothetical protein n=1 Tax=Edaphovirga cremea TaxID=2267246 RepID=UPI003989D0B8
MPNRDKGSFGHRSIIEFSIEPIELGKRKNNNRYSHKPGEGNRARQNYALHFGNHLPIDLRLRLAQLSALWYLDWLLNLPVFLPLQAMKEESN